MKTMLLLREKGYEFGNADCTICAEQPKINPYIKMMQSCLAEVMNVDKKDISIKATTNEKMGFVGRKEGIAAYAVVMIYKNM
jgi:2-C-methyl-D-erythritol 2,4-cyclodiphosphate synthase